METLLDDIFYGGPQAFSSTELSQEKELFRKRTALFYTPSENLPEASIGEGKLDVTIPIPFPTLFDWNENPAYRIPRLWVDLIQRATGKLRWTPIIPARVTLIRYDSTFYGTQDVFGAKALLDALKYTTTGRRDGMTLYYFGAIYDDNSQYLKESHYKQDLVCDPSQACTRIIVEPADPMAQSTLTISVPCTSQQLPI